MTDDEKLAALADELDGFAGLFVDQGGDVVVSLVDEGKLETHKPRLREFVTEQVQGRSDGLEAARAAQGDRIDRARSQRATYSFRQLHDWHVLLGGVIWASGEVTLTDVDEARNRVVIGVSDSSKFDTVRQLASKTGVPPEAVLVEHFGGTEQLSSTAPFRAQSLQSKVRPVVGGLEIRAGQEPACTLGYNVADMVNGQYQGEYWVTNSHCTSTLFGPGGYTSGYQRFATPGDKIGVEVADPPLWNTPAWQCPSGFDCRYSDAALFQYTSGASSYKHGHIAWPALGSLSFSTTRPIEYTTFPLQGMVVSKVGRSSGRTQGTVSTTCANILHELATNDLMLCTAVALGMAPLPGDSGSPVVHEASGVLYDVGLLWGRNRPPQAGQHGWFSHASSWKNELAAALGAGHQLRVDEAAAPPPVSVSITGDTYACAVGTPSGNFSSSVGSAGSGVTYEWKENGVVRGASSSYSLYSRSPGSKTVELKVTRTADGSTDTDTRWVTVYAEGSGPCPE